MTKNEGTKTTARQVEASMPLATAMPSDCRDAAPAPVARISGTTPRIKVKDVMRIGRKRRRAASTAASRMERPSARRWRAISTMRMAFLAESAMSRTRPIWT